MSLVGAEAVEMVVQQQTPAALASDAPSVFREGFYSPSTTCHSQMQTVPWSSVRQVMAMARDALKAKQCVAEQLAREVDVLKQTRSSDLLLARAQRAEVDSGSLLDELQQLIQAKADVAQQRADLDRANALLMAERQLLCEQLQVSPDNANLCQAVSKVLAAAKRTKMLDVQLRLLAKFQRELLLQLEARREEAARTARQWQAREQVYLHLLSSNGIAAPDLPSLQEQAGTAAPPPSAANTQGGALAPLAAAGLGSSAGGSASISSSSSSVGAAVMTQLMLMRMQSGGVAEGGDVAAGSPALTAQMLPATPPVSAASPLLMRRSHSLDSGLNSLTGLLDQLALGQIGGGSDEGADGLFDDCEHDSDSIGWMLADAMSADSETLVAAATMAAAAGGCGQQQQHQPAGKVQLAQAAAAPGGAASAVSGGSSKGQDQQHHGLMHHHSQQLLQPVPEDVTA